MKRMALLLFLLLSAGTAAFAQLTTDQKLADFGQLVGLFDKRYAPYEWKKQVFQFDMLDAQPWLDRVAKTQTDLDYYELCMEYVASLHDANSAYILPSDFRARLGFSLNMIQGQGFISSVDRGLLPASAYPFDFGDIVISVDGKTPSEWIASFIKYAPVSSPRTADQTLASFITDRRQQSIPRAVEVGDRADVVILRPATGTTETYSIPWIKTGTPLSAGPVPSAKAVISGPPQADAQAPSGPLLPLYRLPEGFVQRLGRTGGDFFLSGTYSAGGRNLGYLRIGGFNSAAAPVLAQLDAELAYLQQNTDGLIIDDWGTGGANQCYAEELAARFLASPFPTVGYALRATRDWITFFESRLNLAPPEARSQIQANLDQVVSAYEQNRGLTEPLPLCGNTIFHAPAATVFTKPVVLLVNELSSGPAEFFAATLQDAGRAVVFGGQTAGLGTTNNAFSVGSYAEGIVLVSVALAVRPNEVSVPGFPATRFIENAGVFPDVLYDAFTAENLATLGAPYVAQFTQTLLDQIK